MVGETERRVTSESLGGIRPKRPHEHLIPGTPKKAQRNKAVWAGIVYVHG
jgi:hypothetical protein